MPQSAKSAQFKFRLDSGLSDKIEAAAATNGRSFSEEIRRRLDASFDTELPAAPSVSPALRDVLRAIGEAAVFSSGLDAGFDYAAFEAGVPVLIEALRPHDRGPEEDWVASSVASAALNAIGKGALIGRLMEIIKRRYGGQ
jgi:hypothetical protein